MATVHIESKKEDIANIVLMPGDPKRAQYIADKFLTDVKLVNSVRGMTAYTGYYKNKKVTVFPSGMGNPSMGIYSYELLNEYDVPKSYEVLLFSSLFLYSFRLTPIFVYIFPKLFPKFI